MSTIVRSQRLFVGRLRLTMRPIYLFEGRLLGFSRIWGIRSSLLLRSDSTVESRYDQANNDIAVPFLRPCAQTNRYNCACLCQLFAQLRPTDKGNLLDELPHFCSTQKIMQEECLHRYGFKLIFICMQSQ